MTRDARQINGSITKYNENSYKVRFRVNGINSVLGYYPTRELAEEARKYFISIGYDLDKFRESKYWKKLRRIGISSQEYINQGSITRQGTDKDNNGYCVSFWMNKKNVLIGTYTTKELAEEARQYFISINYDMDKFKESKYWLKRNDKRQASKNYWNNLVMNSKNTSGITGVRLDRTCFKNGTACWEGSIEINYNKIRKYFFSKEAAIKFRQDLEKLGNEFNADHDQKRLEEQKKLIEEHARNMEEEKAAKMAAEAYRKGLENPDGEDTTTWDSINDDDILDSISYVEQSSQAPNNFSGKYYQIKINETGELVDVYERDDEIALYLADKDKKLPYSRFSGFLNGAIGRVKINGKELFHLAVDPNYQGYKLGDFLVKKAVEDYGCERVVCNGTRAYRLYRKYGFIPYTEIFQSKEELEEHGVLNSIVTLFQHPRKYQQWYVDYCDKNYKGQIDSKPKRRKIMQVGDSIKFKDGRTGIVEDYDDKFYYVRDNNTNLVKVKKDVQDSKLSKLIGEVSTFTNNKNYDVLDFKKKLEENGFKVEYMENKSGTWQESNGEYYKDYDVVLEDGTRIFFRLIADDNFDSKEVIAYTNGKVKKVKDAEEENLITKFELDMSTLDEINYEYDNDTFKTIFTVSFDSNDANDIFGKLDCYITLEASCNFDDIDLSYEKRDDEYVPYGEGTVLYEKGDFQIESVEIEDYEIDIQDITDTDFMCDNDDVKKFEEIANKYNLKYASDPKEMLKKAIEEFEDNIKNKFKKTCSDWVMNNQEKFLNK